MKFKDSMAQLHLKMPNNDSLIKIQDENEISQTIEKKFQVKLHLEPLSPLNFRRSLILKYNDGVL